MKVRYVGDRYKVTLEPGAEYAVKSIEEGFYRIDSEVGDSPLFSPDEFEVVEAEPVPPIMDRALA